MTLLGFVKRNPAIGASRRGRPPARRPITSDTETADLNGNPRCDSEHRPNDWRACTPLPMPGRNAYSGVALLLVVCNERLADDCIQRSRERMLWDEPRWVLGLQHFSLLAHRARVVG